MVYLTSKHFVEVNFIRGKKQNISKCLDTNVIYARVWGETLGMQNE